jgi:hypothetical protein
MLAAARSRDEGRARARSLTWWAAVAASAVTGIGAGIAAATIPGHNVAQAQSAAPSAGSGATDPGAVTPGSGSDPGSITDPGGGGFTPAQPPSFGRGSGPAIVSGGS